MANIKQLDATELYCPEFALPAREFLEGVETGSKGHIVTREKNAEIRLKHICTVYEWELKGPHKEGDLYHFIVTK